MLHGGVVEGSLRLGPWPQRASAFPRVGRGVLEGGPIHIFDSRPIGPGPSFVCISLRFSSSLSPPLLELLTCSHQVFSFASFYFPSPVPETRHCKELFSARPGPTSSDIQSALTPERLHGFQQRGCCTAS
jgi:hypothetical protein